MYGFRARGIYSTAVSKILMDGGLRPGDISDKISRRLGAEAEGYVDVTVKNADDNRSLIVVVGIPGAVDEAYRLLRGVLRRSLYRGPLPLYIVFRTRAVSQDQGGCYVETPLGIQGYLRDRTCYKGEEFVATIVGYRDDGVPVIDRGIYVVGRNMILLDKPIQRVSEHIRDPDVIMELKGVTDMILRHGLGVHWRSSASRASTKDLLEEFEELRKTLSGLSEKARSSQYLEPLYVGEKIAFIHLSIEDMAELDRIRSSVTPTAPMHHAIRAYIDYPDLADLLDSIVASGSDPRFVSSGLKRYVAEKLYPGLEAVIIHNKPFEKPITLGKGRLRVYDVENGSISLGIVRSITGSGLYDGLGIQRERDDRALTIVSEDSWVAIHAYYSQSLSLKGVYVNINTRPAILYDGILKIAYLDLEIDAAIVNGEFRVIDEKSFERICGDGEIELCVRARRTLDGVRGTYSSIWASLKDLGAYLAQRQGDTDPLAEGFKSVVAIMKTVSS